MSQPDRIIIPEGGWINPTYPVLIQKNLFNGSEITLDTQLEPDQETIEKIEARFAPFGFILVESTEVVLSPFFPTYAIVDGAETIPTETVFIFGPDFKLMDPRFYGKQLGITVKELRMSAAQAASIFKVHGPEENFPRAEYVGSDSSRTIYNSLAENAFWDALGKLASSS